MTTEHRCGELDAVLSAYVDHEVTAAEMAAVEAHAQTCRACAARLRRYQALTPRLEADLRAIGIKADAGAPRFRRPPDRAELAAPRVPLLSRLATVALLLAVAVMVGVVLLRSAPAARTPGGDTGAQPSPPTAVQTPDSPGRAPVLVASIGGLIDPAVAAYMHRAVSTAADSHAAALVVVLDASGGLDGPMQQVAQDLAGSSVPTLAFIPPGRSDVADTSLARSTGLVISAPNVDALLRAVDGTEARTPAGPVTLATAGAPIDTFDMEPWEAVAHRVMDPTTAYLLFVLGLYAAFVELAHPGSLVPGATGLVCLALASVAFAVLPTNWLGVAVLVAAVGLMALELKAATHGALVLAGVVCLVAGSILLYAAPGSWVPIDAEVTIPPAVLIGAVAAGLVVGLMLARIARRIHNLPPVLSLEQLIGARGVSRGDLDPDGVVRVGGQLWSARLRGGSLEAGQPIRVVARHGLVLEVESAVLGAATRKGTLS